MCKLACDIDQHERGPWRWLSLADWTCQGPLGAPWGSSGGPRSRVLVELSQCEGSCSMPAGGAVTPSAAQVIRRITGKQLPQAAGCRNPFTADLTDLHPSRGMPDTDSVRTLFLSRECFPLKFRIESYAPQDRKKTRCRQRVSAARRLLQPLPAQTRSPEPPARPRAEIRRGAERLGGRRARPSSLFSCTSARDPVKFAVNANS